LVIPKINTLEQSGGHRLGKKQKKILLIVGIVFLIIFVFTSIVGFLGYQVYVKAMATVVSAQKLEASAKEQNLDKIKESLVDVKKSVSNLSQAYTRLAWLKVLPFVGSYIQDGQRALTAAKAGLEAGDLVVKTIEPYADIIGLKTGSEQAKNAEETTQDRIDFIIKTIPNLLPAADELGQKMAIIRRNDKSTPIDIERIEKKEKN
jgi:cell division protein FtsB